MFTYAKSQFNGGLDGHVMAKSSLVMAGNVRRTIVLDEIFGGRGRRHISGDQQDHLDVLSARKASASPTSLQNTPVVLFCYLNDVAPGSGSPLVALDALGNFVQRGDGSVELVKEQLSLEYVEFPMQGGMFLLLNGGSPHSGTGFAKPQLNRDDANVLRPVVYMLLMPKHFAKVPQTTGLITAIVGASEKVEWQPPPLRRLGTDDGEPRAKKRAKT
jgi:hypothetical protein